MRMLPDLPAILSTYLLRSVISSVPALFPILFAYLYFYRISPIHSACPNFSPSCLHMSHTKLPPAFKPHSHFQPLPMLLYLPGILSALLCTLQTLIHPSSLSLNAISSKKPLLWSCSANRVGEPRCSYTTPRPPLLHPQIQAHTAAEETTDEDINIIF